MPLRRCMYHLCRLPTRRGISGRRETFVNSNLIRGACLVWAVHSWKTIQFQIVANCFERSLGDMAVVFRGSRWLMQRLSCIVSLVPIGYRQRIVPSHEGQTRGLGSENIYALADLSTAVNNWPPLEMFFATAPVIIGVRHFPWLRLQVDQGSFRLFSSLHNTWPAVGQFMRLAHMVLSLHPYMFHLSCNKAVSINEPIVKEVTE